MSEAKSDETEKDGCTLPKTESHCSLVRRSRPGKSWMN